MNVKLKIKVYEAVSIPFNGTLQYVPFSLSLCDGSYRWYLL